MSYMPRPLKPVPRDPKTRLVDASGKQIPDHLLTPQDKGRIERQHGLFNRIGRLFNNRHTAKCDKCQDLLTENRKLREHLQDTQAANYLLAEKLVEEIGLPSIDVKDGCIWAFNPTQLRQALADYQIDIADDMQPDLAPTSAKIILEFLNCAASHEYGLIHLTGEANGTGDRRAAG